MPSEEPGHEPSVSPDSTCVDVLGILLEARKMGRGIQDRAHVMHSFDLLRTLKNVGDWIAKFGVARRPFADRTGTQTTMGSTIYFVVLRQNNIIE